VALPPAEYYGLVRLPGRLLRLLPLQLSADYLIPEQPGSPKFLTVPFVIMPWPQTPGSSAALAIPHYTMPPSSSWTLSALPTRQVSGLNTFTFVTAW